MIKTIINKTVYLIGLLTILLILYICSFFLIRNNITRPYFIKHGLNESHPITPWYNVIYYPMRWFIADGRCIRSEHIKDYYGWIGKSSYSQDDENMRSVTLYSYDRQTISSIGFTGDSNVLESFDKTKTSDYARMKFGTALASNSDSFINRLVSIEVIDLMDDPRILEGDFSEEYVKKVNSHQRNLSAPQKQCVTDYIRDYQDKVFDHCRQSGYAANIGGECYHIVGYAISTAVVLKSFQSCGIDYNFDN